MWASSTWTWHRALFARVPGQKNTVAVLRGNYLRISSTLSHLFQVIMSDYIYLHVKSAKHTRLRFTIPLSVSRSVTRSKSWLRKQDQDFYNHFLLLPAISYGRLILNSHGDLSLYRHPACMYLPLCLVLTYESMFTRDKLLQVYNYIIYRRPRAAYHLISFGTHNIRDE